MVVPNPIAKIQKISVSHEEYSENQRKGKDKRNDSFIRVLIHFQKDFCKTP